MNEVLKNTAVALDEVAEAVRKGWSDDRTLREVFGYHHPALNRHDIAEVADLLASRIRRADVYDLDEDIATSVQNAPGQIRLLKSDTIANFYNGNGWQAVPAYFATLDWLESALEPILYWKRVTDTKLMPANLARRVRAIQARLDEISPETDELQRKIQIINDASEAADSLPTDLESLKSARAHVESISSAASSIGGKIEQRHEESERILAQIDGHAKEAKKLVEQCSEAYRVTTTVGLAASFDQRAKSLAKSMWVWVAGLLLALAIGALIGARRVELLTAALSGPAPNWGVIWIHIVLSLVSVGAPLWFAWLATKQIGQRFRLAEDYGFKASVAKAYEGYRREAARIDETFEARLFSSALTRLEEAPLRLVEEESHGSPWHELINSEAFANAMEKIPSLRETFARVSRRSSGQGTPQQQVKTGEAVGAEE